ncbi:hypothetical protein FNV43_RR19070 [Rhamnella rubrinervis]|uniref:Alcohol dehydrogenase-like N-terminal domain-containing protein n=1 Tax=Rhamnella rubrinervis TaxID=2594499 RepID=A0A8K0GW68_9ROSA|nr:hypothetical protein FNV43_RR19070 [Rhamnella rubrinervis]
MARATEEEHAVKAFGWAARNSSGHLSPFHFSRRHEIVGEVTEIGSKVKNVKVGDKVGVGCMVGACHSCDLCNEDLENYCPKMVLTYSALYYDGTVTYGGYPIQCPLKYFGLAEPGKHVGIVGLGGLGHVAVKFAKALGAKVID